MGFLDKLERRFGRYAVHQLSLLLVIGQICTLILSQVQPGLLEDLVLAPDPVYAGEVWRLVSFLLLPPSLSLLFAAFALYLFYLMGSALEAQWGEFHYNVYVLIGWGGTVAVTFAFPDAFAGGVTNLYILTSVELAFAYLYPDFELLLFFVLPVKIKYLAALIWVGYGVAILFGPTPNRLMVLASVANFFLFFGRDIYLGQKYRRRRTAHTRREEARAARPLHSCAVCGVTDNDDRNLEFRVCSSCTGGREYCEKHIRNHTHQ